MSHADAAVKTIENEDARSPVKPLRILVAADVPPDPNAGAAGTVYQMNLALRRLGHHVDEIWAGDLGRRIRHGNLHYLLELPLTYRHALRQHLKHSEYDVVEFNQPHAYLAAADFQRRRGRGVFVNRSHGHEVRVEEVLKPWQQAASLPSPYSVRKLASRLIRPILDRHWDWISRTANGFHFSCQEDGEFLHQRYKVPRERIGVIRQGVPDVFLDQPVASLTDQRRRRLLYIGQYAFVKAPHMLARAVCDLLGKHADLTMTWVCSNEHHPAVWDLLPEKIRTRVTLLNWMSQDSLIEVLDRHGIFLFPSFFEGFGKAPLEAMARGLCVVASRTGGMMDYIENGVSGFLTTVGKPDEMVHSVEQLVSNPALANAISVAAREAALKHRWDRCAADLTQFYRRLLQQKHSDELLSQNRT